MKIDIKYNDREDEFIADLSLEMRLKRYINKNFYPAYVISRLAPIYLVGGAIRDLINAREPKDLDFVVLGNDNIEWVLEVLNKFSIKYEFNRFGGFKFVYEGKSIDLWTTKDLFSAMQYNVDGLFFDLKSNSLVSFTFNDFCENGLKLVNEENNIVKGRELKLVKFETDFRKFDI